MKRIIRAKLSVLGFFILTSCNTQKQSFNNMEVNSSPTKVLETIFQAAKSGDFSQMKNLCDPQNQGDGDTKDLCKIAEASQSHQQEFIKYFKPAKITGEPQIDGDRASIDFLFGPNGQREETMNLVRRGEKWYLLSF